MIGGAHLLLKEKQRNRKWYRVLCLNLANNILIPFRLESYLWSDSEDGYIVVYGILNYSSFGKFITI